MKNKYGNIALAVLMAFLLWWYVITVVSPEQERTYYGVSVNLEGETLLRERGLMIISDPDLSVRVDLKGSRQDLNNLNSSNITLVANLAGIYDAGEHRLGYTVGYPGNIPNGAVTVMNKEPSAIVIEVAEKISRVIPVHAEYIGNAADGFVADETQAVLEYTEVTITGPRQTVEEIDHAYIQVDCTSRTESVSESYRFVLRDKQGTPVDAAMITTNIDQIHVNVPVFMTKQIPLKLVVNPGGGATEETSSIVFSHPYLDVIGSESALEDFEEIVLGTINLAEILGDTQKVYPITLPEGVTEMNGVAEVTVDISFPELLTKELTVTNIVTNHVPEGMLAELLTKQLTITVRGPKELMEKLTAEQIVANIDLTGVENTAALEARLVFPAGYEAVGQVGKYSVNVKVEPIPEETTAPPETTEGT